MPRCLLLPLESSDEKIGQLCKILSRVGCSKPRCFLPGQQGIELPAQMGIEYNKQTSCRGDEQQDFKKIKLRDFPMQIFVCMQNILRFNCSAQFF